MVCITLWASCSQGEEHVSLLISLGARLRPERKQQDKADLLDKNGASSQHGNKVSEGFNWPQWVRLLSVTECLLAWLAARVASQCAFWRGCRLQGRLAPTHLGARAGCLTETMLAEKCCFPSMQQPAMREWGKVLEEVREGGWQPSTRSRCC